MSSSPVDITAILSFLKTVIVDIPAAAHKAIFSGDIVSPGEKIVWFFAKFSPNLRIKWGFDGLLRVTLSPATVQSSIGIIESAPCGIGAPVMILIA